MKRSYEFEKRRKELARKKKQEEKRQRRFAKGANPEQQDTGGSGPGTGNPGPVDPESGTSGLNA